MAKPSPTPPVPVLREDSSRRNPGPIIIDINPNTIILAFRLQSNMVTKSLGVIDQIGDTSFKRLRSAFDAKGTVGPKLNLLAFTPGAGAYVQQ
jgi:hypothetical protein